MTNETLAYLKASVRNGSTAALDVLDAYQMLEDRVVTLEQTVQTLNETVDLLSQVINTLLEA